MVAGAFEAAFCISIGEEMEKVQRAVMGLEVLAHLRGGKRFAVCPFVLWELTAFSTRVWSEIYLLYNILSGLRSI